MPYIASDGSPGAGLAALGQSLFPDPARIGQAQYLGAQSRQLTQSTSDAVAKAQALATLPDAVNLAQSNPTPENLARAQTVAMAAGLPASQSLGAVLSANAAGSSPIPAGQADAAAGYGGAQPYTQSRSYQNQQDATQIQQSNIAAGPAYQAQALDRLKYGNQRDAYMNPTTGETTYMPPGQTPGQGFVPVANAAPLSTALAPNPYVVANPSAPNQATTEYLRPTQPIPNGAIPYNPQNPAQSGAGFGMFGPGAGAGAVPPAPAQPAPQPGAQAPGGVSVNLGPGGGGLGALLSGGAPAAQPAPPATPTSPAPGAQAQAPAPQQPNAFAGMAQAMAPNLGLGAKEDAKEQTKVDTIINDRVKQYNADNNVGLGSIGTKNYALSGPARDALQTRMSQLKADRSNRATFNSTPAALNQAWKELLPNLVPDSHHAYNFVNGPSLLKLPGEGAQASAQAASGQPDDSATMALLGRAAPGPAQAAPGPAQAAPGPAQAAPGPMQPAPGPAQAAPAPTQAARIVIPSAGARVPGKVYVTPRGPMVWAGTGWVPPQQQASNQ